MGLMVGLGVDVLIVVHWEKNFACQDSQERLPLKTQIR